MTSPRWAWTHRYAVPLFVSSLVAVVLSGASVVAVVVYDPGGGDDPIEAESCLVGQWQVVAHREGSELGSVVSGTMELVGTGPRFTFEADGSGWADYNPQIQYETNSLGETVPLVVSGEITFRYEASGDTFQLTSVDSNASAEFPIFGRLPFDLDRAPVRYRCAGDTATFSNPDRSYQAEYQRI